MGSSIARVTQVHGNNFAERVGRADEVAPAPAVVPRLPTRTIELLANLETFSEEDAAARGQFIAQQHALNESILAFVVRMLAVRVERLESEHEEIKSKIRQQDKVLRDLERKIVEDREEYVKLCNAREAAINRASAAEEDRANISRYAPKSEKLEADARVNDANEKKALAVEKTGEAWGFLQSLAMTVKNENAKLDALRDREIDVDSALSGRDPFLRKYGFVEK
jgi:hypothetical protein